MEKHVNVVAGLQIGLSVFNHYYWSSYLYCISFWWVILLKTSKRNLYFQLFRMC